MNRLAIVLLVLAFPTLAVAYEWQQRLIGRLGELEAQTRQQRAEQRRDLASSERSGWERLSGFEARVAEEVVRLAEEELDRRLAVAEAELARLEQALGLEAARIEEVERSAHDGLEERRKHLTALETDLAARWQELEHRLAESRAEQAQAAAAASAGVDPDTLWRELMGPVVQVVGRFSVGSGVLLPSRPRAEGGYRTHILTAWHVVRDGDGRSTSALTVPVTLYAQDGTKLHERARLITFDAVLDMALFELERTTPVPHAARLATPERLARVRAFEPVFAVGCPLGNDPIPTSGQVASPRHEVDGARYVMINAPTYIGNSGGAVYDGETFDLLGVFSKIYNHGQGRPTIVPHMGLVTPLDAILDWLGTQDWHVDGEHGSLARARELAPRAVAASAPSAVR